MEVQRALMLHKAGDVAAAAEIYSKVLLAIPDQLECLQFLGVARAQLGRAAEAVPLLERALALRRNDATLLSNYGFALVAASRPADALVQLERALALRPGAFEALDNKGRALQALRRFEEALACFDQALAIHPGSVDVARRRAIALSELHRHDEALAAFQALLATDPRDSVTLMNLGNLLTLMGRGAEARATLQRAIELDPKSVELRLRHAVAWLPLVRESTDDLPAIRSAFKAELEQILGDLQASPRPEAASAVGVVQPFYIAYQEQDNVELLRRFGAISEVLMAQSGHRGVARTVSETPGRVRVGIASSHVFSHSVWQAIVRGWVEEIDRQRFEVVVFHLGSARDDQTAIAQARADVFVEGGRQLSDWISTIQDARLDVLVYPELGMDPLTLKLASLRLAPVQAASWGHPETTGLPTIDFYLSAERFEDADSDAHYSETLVRLPNLGSCVVPDSVRATTVADDVDLEQVGVRAGATLIICAGTPFKYTPEHDAVLVRIAQQIPSAQFLFFEHSAASALSARLMRRISTAFSAAQLDPARHLVVAPWMDRAKFLFVLGKARLFLDTIGFSGFNTVMQAVEAGVPVVTQRGRFMRGRLGSGILEHLGLADLVTHDDASTVALAARLCLDDPFRESVRIRLARNRAALYGDTAPVRALEECLWAWAGRTADARASV